MKPLLTCVLLAFGLSLAAPVTVSAQQTRAYAPENLRTLSRDDQVRVIGLEYSEQSNGRRIPDDQLRFYLDQVNRSDWTFSRIKQDMAQSLAGNGGVVGPQPPVGGGSIRCESRNNKQQNCPTPWPSRSQMVRQLSGTACIEGRNWDSQRGSVWVSGGCRAEFAAARDVAPMPGNGYRVTCSSQGGRYKACAWDAAYGQPQLSRQLSGQACVAGSSWGYDGRGLWVNNGCRAEFSARRGPNPGVDYSVTCSSTGNRPTTCAWDARYGRPYLVQQLSGSPCNEGRSWGYQGGASLWVSGGCRARFGAR